MVKGWVRGYGLGLGLALAFRRNGFRRIGTEPGALVCAVINSA